MIRNVRNAEMFGVPLEGESKKRERGARGRPRRFTRARRPAPVSRSDQSYASHPPQAASLIIRGRNKSRHSLQSHTPDGKLSTRRPGSADLSSLTTA